MWMMLRLDKSLRSYGEAGRGAGLSHVSRPQTFAGSSCSSILQEVESCGPNWPQRLSLNHCKKRRVKRLEQATSVRTAKRPA